jgi:mono/diheme cytochrome c family protein
MMSSRSIQSKSMALAFVGVLAAASAAHAADAANGERLAQRWCASCHLVGPGQQQASTDAPPFASVARRPDFNTGSLALFLLNPHPKMPSMDLTRPEAEDLAAYIGSLR